MFSLPEESKNCTIELFVDNNFYHVELFPASLSAQEIYAKLRGKFGKIFIFDNEDHYGRFYPHTEESSSIPGLPSEYLDPNEVYSIPLFKKIKKKFSFLERD